LQLYHYPFLQYSRLIQKNKIGLDQEHAVLVGVIQKLQNEFEVNEYLDELSFLAETAGAKTKKRFVQKLYQPDKKTFIGSGKLEEIKNFVSSRRIGLVIFDDELSGSQITNIEKVLNVKTIDRSDLILDIFASRAKTKLKRTVEL
jgi:GTP-binding protein HflX